MNALSVIGVALNIVFFMIVIAGVLAMLDENKISPLQIMFYLSMEIVFTLNIFLITR